MFRRWAKIATVTVAGGGIAGYSLLNSMRMLVSPPTEYVQITVPTNELEHLSSPWRSACRMLWVAFVFMPIALLYPVMVYFPRFKMAYYHLIKRVLELSGPAFVKLGQWAVTREDLLPADMCLVLSELHRNVRHHSMDKTIKTIESEFGRPINEIFLEFDPHPLGSGSIAQVHKARLLNGERVAVKVCHPGVQENIATDFRCIKWVADKMSPYVNIIDLKAVADQFATNLSLQIDLRYEAKNLDMLCKNFSHVEQIKLPVPKMELTTEKVMVESFIDAHPMQDLMDRYKNCLSDLPERNKKLCKIGVDCFMQMIIADNFFHADLHPGNVLYGFDESNNDKPFLCMVDAGIIQTLSREQRDNMFAFMQGLQLRSYEKVAQTVLRMSCKGQPFADRSRFISKVGEAFKELMPEREQSAFKKYLKTFGFYRIQSEHGQIGRIIQRLFQIAREERVILDSSYASLLFSALMMETMCNSIDPTFDTVAASQSWFMTSPLRSLLGMNQRKTHSHY